MAQSISDIKKSRGRPVTTGTGTPVVVRLQPDQLARIDAWRSKAGETRPGAIRKLVDKGLSASGE
jgi:hypothetical protein